MSRSPALFSRGTGLFLKLFSDPLQNWDQVAWIGYPSPYIRVGEGVVPFVAVVVVSFHVAVVVAAVVVVAPAAVAVFVGCGGHPGSFHRLALSPADAGGAVDSSLDIFHLCISCPQRLGIVIEMLAVRYAYGSRAVIYRLAPGGRFGLAEGWLQESAVPASLDLH